MLPDVLPTAPPRRRFRVQCQWEDPRNVEGDPFQVAEAAVTKLEAMAKLFARAVVETEVVVCNARMQEALEAPRNELIETAEGVEVSVNDEPFEWWLASPDQALLLNIKTIVDRSAVLIEALGRHHAHCN